MMMMMMMMIIIIVSATGTETLQQQFLLCSVKAGTIDTTASSISDIWSSLCSVPRPSGAVAYKQSAWDKVAVASVALRPTQPSIPPGSVNEYQLRLGRQRQVWFIPIADERGVCR